MSFFPRQKPDADCADPGDSTYTIHQRIFKGTNWRQAGASDHFRMASRKTGFN